MGPARVVRFERPIRLGLFAGPPFVLAGFLTGPAIFVMSGGSGEPLASRLFSAAGLGLLGVIIGVFALVPTWEGRPHRVVFDWSARTLTIADWIRETVISFDELSALELARIRNRGTGEKHRYPYYRCGFQAVLKNPSAAAAGPVPLLETTLFDDPETPYAPSLPLATELAQALGLPLRVIVR